MGMLDSESVFGFAPPLRAETRHEIGAALDGLSIDEIGERIQALQSEIDRLEAALEAKQSTRRAADSFFKL